MTSWSSENNKYIKLSTKRQCILADIWFLKQCINRKVFPKFIKIQCKNYKKDIHKILLKTKIMWLKFEISIRYNKLSYIEAELYNQHLKLSKNNPIWDDLDRKTQLIVTAKLKNKYYTLNKKLKNLIKQKEVTTETITNNIIHNKSKIILTTEQINLLNKGLKHCVTPKKLPIQDILVDIENAISRQPIEIQQTIRKEAEGIINQINIPKIKQNSEELEVIKELKRKQCYFTKADKGNAIVVIDKEDYVNQVNLLIDTGPYEKLRKNPITSYTTKFDKILKKCTNLISNDLRKKLLLPNPNLARMYCLPKIHKPGNSYRPIVSNINTTTYNLSSWLVTEFKNLNFKFDFSVTNSKQVTDNLNNFKLEEKDRLISFDVTSLFPNVPIDDTISILEKKLQEMNLEKEITQEYILLTKTCMDFNAFTFNNNAYKQTFGTAMGNPLSPFLANLFLDHLENKIKNEAGQFPKIWLRYMDDIFAIINNNFNIENFITYINSLFPTIKFTYELETDNWLAFLDLKIIKNNNILEFDIYRKPTNTENYTHNSSYTPDTYKMSTFSSMFHRLLSTPINKQRFKTEFNYILHLAEVNGFDKNPVVKLFNKIKKKSIIKNYTTLTPDNINSNYRKFTFHKSCSLKFKNLFKKFNITLAFSNKNTLKNLLNSNNNNKNLDCSGIYAIKCNNCNLTYIGQTKRKITTRFKEHVYKIKTKNISNSALALHRHNTGHNFSLDNTTCEIKSNNLNLNMQEAIVMKKHCNNLLNFDLSPLDNPLLKFVKMKPPPVD